MNFHNSICEIKSKIKLLPVCIIRLENQAAHFRLYLSQQNVIIQEPILTNLIDWTR